MVEVRSTHEVIRIIEAAKLHPSDLNPTVQEIHFHSEFCGNELRLLELDVEVERHIVKGSSLVLRGEASETAVICTEDSTFELKDAEISNSLLIMEELSFLEKSSKANGTSMKSTTQKIPEADGDGRPVEERSIVKQQILSIAHSYFEMRRMKPNLGRIIYLLEPTRFSGVDGEHEINQANLISMDILINTIPASINEIQDYLNTLRYIEMDGCLRLVDTDYLFRVLNFALGVIDENSWSNDKVVKEVVIAQLSAVEPEIVLEKIFEWFFVPSETALSPDADEQNDLVMDEDLYTLNQDLVCQLFGEVILKRGSRFNFREFLKSWQDSVPSGLKVDVKQLKNISVVDETSSPPTIQYFAEFSLPSNIQERLSILFEIKPKWKHEDIMPFVISLATSEQNAAILLTKFCRVASLDGVKFYSAKYLK